MSLLSTLASAFKELTDWHADGLLWLAGQAQAFMERTIGLAAKHRLPTMGARSFLAGAIRPLRAPSSRR